MKKEMFILAATIAVAPFCAQAACVWVDDAHAAAAVAAPSSPVERAAPSEAKATVVVQHAVTLRDQPKSASTGDTVAKADTRVAIEGHVQNGEGSWSYVTANGVGGGWVQESEIGR